MMGYTDRHLRYLYRLLSKDAVLYTEMVTANAIVHNDSSEGEHKLRQFLQHHPTEKPIVLQLGGNDPAAMARAAAISFKSNKYFSDYDELNVNCGCPSDRVAGMLST